MGRKNRVGYFKIEAVCTFSWPVLRECYAYVVSEGPDETQSNRVEDRNENVTAMSHKQFRGTNVGTT